MALPHMPRTEGKTDQEAGHRHIPMAAQPHCKRHTHRALGTAKIDENQRNQMNAIARIVKDAQGSMKVEEDAVVDRPSGS